MKSNQVIESILSIPTKLYLEGIDASFYELLKQTGYFNLHNSIKVVDILDMLKRRPDFADNWLLLSENKRVNSGWYFKKRSDGKYVVGYHPQSSNIELCEYIDIKVACANFIKNEIENIREQS